AISSFAEAEAAGRCEPSADLGEAPRPIAAPKYPSNPRASDRRGHHVREVGLAPVCAKRTGGPDPATWAWTTCGANVAAPVLYCPSTSAASFASAISQPRALSAGGAPGGRPRVL